MVQEIFIFILFMVAIAYVGNLFRKSLNSSTGCSSNCGCDSKDTKKLQDQIIRNQQKK